ncbi:MAG: DNA polymerase II large subunit, partial [Candidatus Brockarchaeota archaeon]|nr:DNA polymerase II large subunit [Candidatus Brockarchaeota archaeon]
GLSNYIPTRDEISRYVEEYRIYERKIGRFQFKVSENELIYALERIPVEVTGVGTDPIEVSAYRNLERVETNYIRGGALRVLIDGVIGRSHKVMKFVKELNLSGWDWLKNLKVSKLDVSSYVDEVLIGRPVISSKDFFGGLRIRYGRARNTGLMAIGLHPSTMYVLNSFVAIGSQLRLDRPGKSAIVASVDSILPPIVKLKNGSVVKLSEIPNKNIFNDIEKILFLGDILISIGDYIENNRKPDEPGYSEDEWCAELKDKLPEFLDKIKSFITEEKLNEVLKDPNKISFDEALFLSKVIGLPLHPKFLNFWEFCNGEDIFTLLLEIKENGVLDREIIIPYADKIKTILEKALVPHSVFEDKIKINEDASKFLRYLIERTRLFAPNEKESGLSYLSRLSGLTLKKLSGSVVSARVGRPEAAKPRYMDPPTNVLFPIGNSGGTTRNILNANGQVKVEIANRYCPRCKKQTFYFRCPECGTKTLPIYTCPRCGEESEEKICSNCNIEKLPYSQRFIDIRSEINKAKKKTNIQFVPRKIKGVKSLMNNFRVPELIEKGVLRAKYNLFVYKDGTCRFDATNAPLTAFKPSEIGVSFSKLYQLGYETDVNGVPLSSDEQLVFIKPQDVVIPKNSIRYLINLSKFIDDLLASYGLEPFYKIENPEDLIGQLIISISPHTVGGIVGRIIGFTEAEVLFAHPFYHQAKRRDCDGDADSFTLALDVFLNFSNFYTPNKPGGKMDSPLVVFPVIDPSEIDDQIYNTENEKNLPYAFYDSIRKLDEFSSLYSLINLIGNNLTYKLNFTHTTTSISNGPTISSYRLINKAEEKFTIQLSLLKKTDFIDKKRVIEDLLSTHLIRDFIGNVKAFYTAGFRCIKCGQKYRRPPLSGKCIRCGYPLQPNVFSSNIVKYYSLIDELITNYDVSPYYKASIKFFKRELSLLDFSEEKDKKLEKTKSSSLRSFIES